jgi:hypothetical protein
MANIANAQVTFIVAYIGIMRQVLNGRRKEAESDLPLSLNEYYHRRLESYLLSLL